ncbi:MAG: hypothetical protein HYV75_05575 [Opitutae bacterium]|nr:hypothetical protein [Opitutae bacterium]
MAPPADGCASVHRPAWLGRCLAGLRWLVPAALLALMPKCPFCLAGYVALATGIGLSFTVASWLRTGLIVLCCVVLGWLVVRAVRRRFGRGSAGSTADGH